MTKSILSAVLISIFCIFSSAQAQELELEQKGAGFHKLIAVHPDGTEQSYIINIPENYDASKPTPLILGLHYGFRPMEGTTLPEPYWVEGFYKKIYEQAFRPLNAIFLAADSVNGNWQTSENEAAVLRLLDSVIEIYNVDARKTIVTGYSMGGFGTWHWASKFQDRFAGAIPIAGMPADMNTFRDDREMLETNWNIPLYIMHSRVDELIDIGPTEEYVKKLQADGKDVTFHILEVLTHHQENLLPEPVGKMVPWIKRIWQNIE